MSVIAWDGKSLVGDQAAHYGDYRLKRVKVYQINNTTYVGFAGKTDSWMAVLGWLKGELPKPEGVLDFAAIIVEQKGNTVEVYSMFDNLTKVPVAHSHFAIGAGADMAMALMHIGYSALSAIEVTCEINVKCEPPFTIFNILP